MRSVACIAWLGGLVLAGCSLSPTGSDIVAQSEPGGGVAYDIVQIDKNVVATLAAHQAAPFHERFKEYVPAKEIKIAVGDTLSIVIWESSAAGLFGYSLYPEFQVRGGTAIQSLFEQSATPTGASSGGGTTSTAPLALGAAPLAAGAAPATASAAPPLLPQQQQQQRLAATSIESGRPGTRLPDQPVGTDGEISVPYAGRILVADRTPEQVQHTIEQRLSGKALDPQALVVVRRSVGNAVSVSGEGIGSRQVLIPGGTRLLQVIVAAGAGPGSAAADNEQQQRPPLRLHEIYVRLSRGGVTATIPLEVLISHPDENIYVEPGDVVTLERQPRSFSVFGAAGKNASIPFETERLSLSEAVAKSGGLLDDRADPTAVFLFRYEPAAIVKALGQPVATQAPPGLTPVAYRFDMRNPNAYLLGKEFQVRDKDVIFVADAELQPISRFFQAFGTVTGPVVSTFAVCSSIKC